MSLPSETVSKTEFSIDPRTQIGHVSLTVGDLDRQVEFYQKVIGLQLRERNGNTASLGAGRAELLKLTEIKGAGRRGRTTGLYHFAILLPDRRELARAMGRLFAMHYRNYPTDHIMTKTTYLDDLEGNGIELYTESPEDGTWSLANGEYITRRADGSLSDGREPLDVEALLTHLREGDRLDAPMPPETKVGHVHLHVRNVEEAVDFYHRIIGFDVMGIARAFRMAFVSAGGYHHHIGLNSWQGEGAPAPAPNSLGLRHFSVTLPDQEALGRVAARVRDAHLASEEIEAGILLRDPSQNGVLLTSRGA
ncbi:MAG TPA: VOC family protein [Anaerolineales bacterium]